MNACSSRNRLASNSTFHLSTHTVASLNLTPALDSNAQDKFNRTALHWAAEMGHLDTADVLLDYGCDVAALECNGR